MSIRVSAEELPAGTAVWLRILSSDLLLMRGQPGALSAGNVLTCVVRSVRKSKNHAIVVVEAGPLWTVDVVRAAVDRLGLTPGAQLQLVAQATSFEVIPRTNR